MKNNLKLLLLVLCLLITVNAAAQVGELQRSTPEAEGVPSRAIITLFDSLMALPQTDIHSLVVLRHGKVIAETYPAPFAPEYRHTMYSCSKTFVSAAVGLAFADNRLRLTDRVAAFFPDQLPDSVSAELADMTVRDLLTMASGIIPDWNMRNIRTDWIHGFLSKPVETPGKRFEYDSISSYLLAAIVQKVTGMTLLDYLKQRLFTPMHITDVAWELSPEGVNTGGWGLHIQSESLAKFGQLLLNHGEWEGKQLLPADWVKQMMTKQMETGGDGYGYQMWLCEYPGAVRADGAYGQYILMIPEKDMVVVITECTLIDGRTQRRLVWKHLLPAVVDEPLVPGKDYNKLQKKQNSYQLPVILRGKSKSPIAADYAGKTFILQTNTLNWQSVSFRFEPQKVVMTVMEKGGASYELPFGYKQWITAPFNGYPPYSVTAQGRFNGIEGPFLASGSYAWQAPDMLRLKVHYVNWISALDLTFSFEGEKLQLRVKENYSSDKGFTIKGHL